ncbi:tRNA adenosine(34) deaminase TadA [Auritidibacter ignavus]|uniref:tRNA adenosine(34) deaminase TadA n=1 Tax=Auritidibacter TaxID=1160973 RepID=UPI002101616B|nr:MULTISPECIES: tRNA adenosine(34) deaminase TadA [Auritidibacter]WGH82807.1 tRNA adenosine(34) deaminase TadA [Auritidibacter ignavus]
MPDRAQLETWMQTAMALAETATRAGDVPIGALLVNHTGTVIGQGYNRREVSGDPTAHAEMLAIRQAASADWRLENSTLIVTLEPCAMCAGAIVAARIPRVIFGAWEPKTGACGSILDVLREPRFNHQVEVIAGIMAEESATLLRTFFRARR